MPNKCCHNRPLRGLDLNRYAGFGLCCERYVLRIIRAEIR